MSLHDFLRMQERLKTVADPVGFLVNLFAHAPVGFAVWEADGRALLTNNAFMDIFGVEPPPEYNVLEDDLLAKNGMLALFQRAFAGETVQVPTFWYDPRELQVVSVREGRRVAFSMTIFPLFDAKGAIEYVAATYKDETEIMLAHERLGISEERQRLAHQAARLGTFEWNVQTGVNLWSPELEAMYGLGPGEFGRTQKSWEDLVHPADRATAIARVADALESASPVDGEWRVCWPDGSEHWIAARFQVFRDREGRPHRLVGVNADVTARKRAEEEVKMLNASLERLVQERTRQLSAANRELEAFSYSVAHDLRAPLRGMNGFAGILLEEHRDSLPPDGVRCLEKIEESGVMMARLIDALLALARVSRGALSVEDTDLSALARGVAARISASEPRADAEVLVQGGLRATVDPALARTLLENLLGNAWKFTGRTPRPRIEVGAEDVDGAHALFVRDNGAGFDMDYVAKLFTPFQRLHSTREFPGTGIGLATSQRIVERHGGRLWGEGKVGAGATFYFTLGPPPSARS